MSKNKGSGQVGQYQDAMLPNHHHTGSGSVNGVWINGTSHQVATSGGYPKLNIYG